MSCIHGILEYLILHSAGEKLVHYSRYQNETPSLSHKAVAMANLGKVLGQ